MDHARRALDDAERLARQRAGPGRSNLTAYSLETLKTGHPFSRPEDLDRLVKALQKSGWQAV
jgi:hypothetical protein